MAPLAEQHRQMQGFTAVFTVLRLLTQLKMSYDAAKTRAEPYTKIVEELPEMRRETMVLVKKAVSENRRAYVLVNNRSEGNAPLTVQGWWMTSANERMTPHLTSILKVRLPRAARDATSYKVSLYITLSRDTVGRTKSE